MCGKFVRGCGICGCVALEHCPLQQSMQANVCVWRGEGAFFGCEGELKGCGDHAHLHSLMCHGGSAHPPARQAPLSALPSIYEARKGSTRHWRWLLSPPQSAPVPGESLLCLALPSHTTQVWRVLAIQKVERGLRPSHDVQRWSEPSTSTTLPLLLPLLPARAV